MAKFLFQGSFTAEGTKGLLKEGGSGRREAVAKLVQSVGGTVEAHYFAFGEDDVVIIADVPSNAAAAAMSLMAGAAGTVNVRTTALLTPEEIDEAAKASAEYRPPGG